MLRKTLYRLGHKVNRSVRYLLWGVLQGLIAAGLIYYGYIDHHYWQIAGLALLIPAVVCLFYGYFGILAYRLALILEDRRIRQRHKSHKDSRED